MTIDSSCLCIGFRTNTGWNAINHGTSGAVEARMIFSVIATRFHGIFTFYANIAIWKSFESNK